MHNLVLFCSSVAFLYLFLSRFFSRHNYGSILISFLFPVRPRDFAAVANETTTKSIANSRYLDDDDDDDDKEHNLLSDDYVISKAALLTTPLVAPDPASRASASSSPASSSSLLPNILDASRKLKPTSSLNFGHLSHRSAFTSSSFAPERIIVTANAPIMHSTVLSPARPAQSNPFVSSVFSPKTTPSTFSTPFHDGIYAIERCVPRFVELIALGYRPDLYSLEQRSSTNALGKVARHNHN